MAQFYKYPTISVANSASVGPTGQTAPTSADEIGFIDDSGDLSGVSSATPLPVISVPATGSVQHVIVDSSALPTGASTAANQATEISSLAIIATNTTNAGTPVVSGTVTANQGAAGGSAWPVDASQSGSWDIDNITGTVSLPTGAATAANQSTGNTSLATIATNTTGAATAANQATEIASLATIAANTGKSPVSATPSFSSGSVSTVDTISAPSNATGFILQALDTNTTNLRYCLGATASASNGMQLQPARDTGFVPCGADISICSESGSNGYTVQWVAQ